MSVSLAKINIPAANATVGQLILFGLLPVRVTNTIQHHGQITLSVQTPSGALLVRTVPAGKLYAPAPAHAA